MTPSEELFSKLFNHEKSLVKDMDDLTLRSHREELAKIAFEARARLTAADDEEKTRKPRKEKGFTRSVKTDDVTSDAINHIVERTKEQKKADKFLEGMAKLGISNDVAATLLSAGTIKAHLDKKNNPDNKPVTEPFVSSPAVQDSVKAHELIEQIIEQVKEDSAKTPKTFVNPFAK